ncbi:hypothetical protein FE773_00195 [Caminibacter mediatlanticus TB-2]|uniref:Uncharacterized protein n=1 Tax=Caminibacter mediatlanticus TB-2 TaxID=391592 RepID=A0AAI9AGU7_9BACT|nr:hypothetical protein [Caminibacter mediatlanticus]EDM23423.1 hypothetical protein CMTB2_09165 [Caminibacter mediatlanticus TB-2]QCT93662.1 hypothetical protein FE773_00195 [Caminibacter mediatlanticus TB-2]
MKNGVALLVTLSFLIIIVVLIGKFFLVYEHISSNTFERAISQNSLFIKDVKKVISSLTKEINSSKELKKIFISFPFEVENIKGIITITSLSNKLNLNLYKNKQKRKIIDQFLENLFNYYNVNDFFYFKNLLLDTYDLDLNERDSYTEIALYDNTFQDGEIYNFKQFKKILDIYAKQRNDKNIYKIPWKKLIYFSDEKSIIDCENANKLLLKFFEINSCKNITDAMKSLDIIPYSKGKNYLIKIRINYNLDNLNIIYNLKTKKVIVENHPIY